MEYISVTVFAEKHGLSERTVRNWCAAGKVEGAFMTGKTWSIPAESQLPARSSGRKKISPLLKRLREEKEGKVSGGIYHRTQIDLTYNSNHIEGSRLTHEQTRLSSRLTQSESWMGNQRSTWMISWRPQTTSAASTTSSTMRRTN